MYLKQPIIRQKMGRECLFTSPLICLWNNQALVINRALQCVRQRKLVKLFLNHSQREIQKYLKQEDQYTEQKESYGCSLKTTFVCVCFLRHFQTSETKPALLFALTIKSKYLILEHA